MFNGARLEELKRLNRLVDAELVTLIKRETGKTVCVNTVANWQKGQSEPKASLLWGLSKALGVPIQEFFNAIRN